MLQSETDMPFRIIIWPENLRRVQGGQRGQLTDMQ